MYHGEGLALAAAATAGALGYVYLRWCERGATPPVLSTSGTLTFQVTMPMRTFLVVFTSEHTVPRAATATQLEHVQMLPQLASMISSPSKWHSDWAVEPGVLVERHCLCVHNLEIKSVCCS